MSTLLIIKIIDINHKAVTVNINYSNFCSGSQKNLDIPEFRIQYGRSVYQHWMKAVHYAGFFSHLVSILQHLPLYLLFCFHMEMCHVGKSMTTMDSSTLLFHHVTGMSLAWMIHHLWQRIPALRLLGSDPNIRPCYDTKMFSLLLFTCWCSVTLWFKAAAYIKVFCFFFCFFKKDTSMNF